ncbi:hypothetical protein SUGI_0169990 [Cryptomeria japonica]|uniref:LRR receptor-like serine/threonine-protein kinase RGI1 n=1 Tax=Cryptomeria japonica TaxID=3369 RepID=UPI002408C9A9|nr:LRR receptor-like serine/threonine-protein kinase RGI1 [Cryptomeria japonica]GLJ11531.1 hypothetical protein SUGI_0169990 [Cryptomeria japonica]
MSLQPSLSLGCPSSCKKLCPTWDWALILCLVAILGVARGDPQAQSLLSWRETLNGSGLITWDAREQGPCGWIGISCSPLGEVVDINLQSMELMGSVPSQLGALTSLQSLVLSETNLSGSIPREIGDYSALIVLDLSRNRLTGSIPLEIGRLNNLEILILNSNELEGMIPPQLGNCSSLVDLVLFDNQLRGKIPEDLGRLRNLEMFRVGGNGNIEGELPPQLGNCSNLTMLGLAETSISGRIPGSFGALKKLKTLALYTALLSGPIPPELGDCVALENLYLYGNSLSGSIPRELGKLQNLQRLFLWQNNLVGRIPMELGNCSAISVMDLSMNALTGSIPATFGKMKNLVELQLSVNELTGSIPAALVNCSRLNQLQVDNNQLLGQVPQEFGQLKNLTLLYAWQNRLEGIIPSSLGDCHNLQSLDLSQNNLTGTIPTSLFQLRNLSKLLLLSNDLTGVLPAEIGNCSALARVRLSGNTLSEAIPREIGRLKNLYFLDLADNQFSGPIPSEIGDCVELQYLDLHMNRLTGSLPGTLGQLSSLQVVDISMNKLADPIPAAAFGNTALSLNKLLLSNNELSGFIPKELGLCTKLQLLDLSSNRLTGGIPPEVGSIEGLNIALNVSWNYLSGSIPWELSRLSKLATMDLSHNMLSGNLTVLGTLENLVSLNVSFNNFTGPLPDTGFFRGLPSSVFAGNAGLCSSCFSEEIDPSIQGSHSEYSGVKLIISLLFGVIALLLFLGIFLVVRTRRAPHEQDESDPEIGWPWQMTLFQKLSVSVEDIIDNLVSSNIIGKGCSGVVYKAQIPNGDLIAVKKLWPSKTSAQQRDSFAAEVKTLGSIRHRNIVKLLGFCTNRTTKLLMYDYMPNGSLGGLLHEKRGMLEWEIRYNIILGAAQGLAYLHHDCLPSIVHRDIKANNILLGSRYEPYIADFGLAKLMESSDFSKSSTNVAGSYGYIAPEYGYTMKITEKIDVYSYGVMLLEVLTGKQPIDPSFRDGMHILDWVKESLEHKRDAVEVLDPRLQGRPDSQIQEMLQALGTALLCVNSNPEERPTMKDVAALLKEIKHDSDDCCPKHHIDLLKQTPSPSLADHSRSPSRSSTSFKDIAANYSHSSLIYNTKGSGKIDLH